MFAIDLIKHGLKYDITLEPFENTPMFMKSFEVPLTEKTDLVNQKFYSFMLNFKATDEISAYICNSAVFEECGLW